MKSLRYIFLILLIVECHAQTFSSSLAFKVQMASGSSHQAATLAWKADVIANGGAAPSEATLTAVDTWYNALVSAGIDSKMIAVNFVAPDSDIAAATPFFKVAGSDPWGTVSLVTTAGFPTSAAQAAQTGVDASAVFSTSDMGLSVYAENTTGNPTFALMGAGNYVGIWDSSGNGGSTYVASYAAWTIASASTGITGTGKYAFLSANRTGTTALNLYSANGSVGWSSVASSASASGSVPAGNISWNGNVTINTVNRVSFVAIHHGLTTTQGQALFNATQALRISFGGGYTP